MCNYATIRSVRFIMDGGEPQVISVYIHIMHKAELLEIKQGQVRLIANKRSYFTTIY